MAQPSSRHHELLTPCAHPVRPPCVESWMRNFTWQTGVIATFRSLLAVRHQHGAAFGRDDMYCVCLLQPETTEITIDENEIGEAAWLPLSSYYESTRATSGSISLAHTM